MAAPVTIDAITSWQQRLTGLLYEQYKNTVTWAGWVTLLARQFQDLENSAQSLLTLLDITNSVGPQLDVIGRIVGQPRLGASDATYRLYLFARVVANKSTSTVEDLYSVFTSLFPGAVIVYKPGFVKQFAIRIVSPVLTRAQALIALEFLGDAREGGARGILEWQESPTSALFTFDAGPGFDVGVYAGALQA